MHANDITVHFTRLLTLLEGVRERRDYGNQTVLEAAAAGAASARDAGLLPEHVLGALRAHLHRMPLVDMGDWYRVVLIDRVVRRVIDGYFTERLDPPNAASPDHQPRS